MGTLADLLSGLLATIQVLLGVRAKWGSQARPTLLN